MKEFISTFLIELSLILGPEIKPRDTKIAGAIFKRGEHLRTDSSAAPGRVYDESSDPWFEVAELFDLIEIDESDYPHYLLRLERQIDQLLIDPSAIPARIVGERAPVVKGAPVLGREPRVPRAPEIKAPLERLATHGGFVSQGNQYQTGHVDKGSPQERKPPFAAYGEYVMKRDKVRSNLGGVFRD